jgi:hypothetical protein
MIAELHKIAIVHLFLLGFEDELSNFRLSLTNPSTQADLLKIDVWKEKILLYKDAVTAIEGIAPVSVTWAKKHVLGFSDDEIKLDLQQQRIEKAVGAELTNTATIISHTGIFDNIDKLYGSKSGTTQSAEVPAPPPPGGGSSFGGGDFGGESDLGGEPELGGEELPPAPEAGGEADLTPESFNRKENWNILLESGNMTDDDSYIDLSKSRNSLGDISKELDKLLND